MKSSEHRPESTPPIGIAEETPDFGKRLIAQRELVGISQATAARDSGVSQGYLSQIENMEIRSSGARTVVGISKALGLPLNFFDGSDDTRVFLRPQAARLEQFLSAPALTDNREEDLRRVTMTLIPQVKITDNIGYVGESTQIRKPLAKRIKEARESRSLTQGLLAEESGVSQGYLSQLESLKLPQGQAKEMDPSLSTIKRLSDALDIDLLPLLGLEEKRYSSTAKYLDRFLRSGQYTPGQIQAIFNRYAQVIGIIQPIVNELSPTPQTVYIR